MTTTNEVDICMLPSIDSVNRLYSTEKIIIINKIIKWVKYFFYNFLLLQVYSHAWKILA
jgi:hypothetical protein